ncbi:MAG: hypothetical protein A2V66_06870 [Ignavibacteria bacterium RBG_13_36_8]|nr:MAG: hypothetical protein A2V66_06870 [Ignavibacteria bacterium RBG_13_36_8]
MCSKIFSYALILIFGINIISTNACTTAIVSGKYTKDGRPLLWKQRDTKNFQNKLMYFNDGKYPYIAVVNSDDPTGSQVWIGFNSAGFAIMNSNSYNLNVDDTTLVKDRDGVIMKLALQNCATIDDFENLLNDLPKPLGVESNFGVIDARGGAAYFETGNSGYAKVDVNDPKIAPYGYIIHTNYSFTGERDLGHGYIRYLTAEELIYEAIGTNDLDYQFILQKISRSLKHSLTNIDLSKYPLTSIDETNFVPFQDFIPRYLSSSSAVVQGVKENESPALTTMWTILGFPLVSITVPVWLTPNGALPKILIAKYPNNAPLDDLAIKLKDKCFPVKRGHGDSYLNLTAILNIENTGILQKIIPLENKIFEESKWRLAKWYNEKINYNEVYKFYNWIDTIIFAEYKVLANQYIE